MPAIKPVWRRSIRILLPLLFALSLLLTLVVQMAPVTANARTEIRGVWLTTNDSTLLRDRTKVQTAMSQLAQLNFNTVYPVVWNSGYALYPSAVAQAANIQPFVYQGFDGQDVLADVAAQAHRNRLLVIPWFEFGFMVPPTSELAMNHPEWLTQMRDGNQISTSAAGEVMWLNPFRPDVQKFITDLVLEIVTQHDVDGIQFDDHMSLPREFGYDPFTVALYTKEMKKAPPANAGDPEWVKWRADKITAFMKQMSQAVKARKSSAIFSISPNYYDFAYRLHLQDWMAWFKQNIFNELVVQVYRSDLDSFVEQVNRPEINEVRQKVPTGIGVLTGLRNSPVSMRQIQSQVYALRDRGLGVVFFYYESLWDDAPDSEEVRRSGFQSLFPYPAARVQ
jgi:uncharacterized lipoprotein YddW (UPF0748 family)